MRSLQKILYNKYTVLTFFTVTLSLGSTTTFASESTRSIKLIKIHPNQPASKLEIISAVKKNFTGRILSIRKKNKINDCHYVKFIDKKGELFSIRVGCKKKST